MLPAPAVPPHVRHSTRYVTGCVPIQRGLIRTLLTALQSSLGWWKLSCYASLVDKDKQSLQFGLCVWVKAIQAGRSVRSLHFLGARIFQNAGRENLLTEIAFIQPAVQDNLIDTLQFTQGELFGQQTKGDGSVVEL